MRRRSVLRIGGWSFVGLSALIGLGAFYPGGLSALAGDVCDYNRNHAELVHEQSTQRVIDSALASRLERYELLVQLRGGLANGSVRLPAAADEYLTAVAADPDLLPQFRASVPGASDHERMAVALLREVFASAPLSSEQQERLLHQFHTTYSATYPLPVPAAGRRPSAEDSSQP